MMLRVLRFKVPSREFSSVFRKDVWTKDNIVKSPCKDIVIPKMTVDEYIWRNLEKWPTKTAMVCGVTNKSYTYEQIYKQSRIFAASLRKKFNITNGDTVAVIMRNSPEYPFISIGVITAGGVVTTINPAYTAREIQRLIDLSETKLIVADPDVVPTIKTALLNAKKDIPIIAFDTNTPKPANTISFKEIMEDKHLDLDVLKSVKINIDDVSILPYSSGTTGLSKPVLLSHYNIVANFEQQNTELRQYRYTTETEQDTTLVCLPMSHFYGLGIVTLHKLSAGLKLVTLPKFERSTFLNVFLKNKFDILYLAPPMVLFFATHPDVSPAYFEKLRSITCGGAPLPPSDIEKCYAKMNKEVQISQAYGMTEAGPLITLSPEGSKRYDTVGYLIPNMEMRVIDEHMNNLGPGEVGELILRGPNMMKGYKDSPQVNSEVFIDGDWFRTGDLAKIDETGLLTVSDRLKELIKINTFQVPPAEIESVIKEHPEVIDAGVVGIPDPNTGERPKAFVVIKESAKVTDKQIIEFVGERVTPYKKIKEVAFIESLPKSQTGKILRRILKEKYC